MGNYIFSIVAASVLAALVCAVSPGGGKDGVGRFVSFAAALAVALTVLAPLSGGIKLDLGLSFTGKTVSEKEAALGQIAAETLSDYLCDTMVNTYSCDRKTIKITIKLEDSGSFKVKEAHIRANGSFERDAAESYLSGLYKFPVYIEE